MDEKVERTLEVGEITFGTAAEAEALPLGPETPFRILMMGDFSGSATERPPCTGAELAARRPRQVHRGNFDEVLRQFDVKLASVLAGRDNEPTTIPIRELDDFEPDRLLEQVDLFKSLCETRRRLLNSSTFKEAAAEVRAWSGVGDKAPAVEEKPAPARATKALSPPTPAPSGYVNLGQILNEAVEETQPSQAAGEEVTQELVDMRSLAAEVVAPYQLEKADPAQADLVACVEEVISKSLRSLLHHPRFQALEATWRSVHFLLKRLETDPLLQVHLVDLSKADLAADLTSAKSFAETGLYRLLVEQSVATPGGEPWALFVGNYQFDATLQDALLAGGLGTIAMAAGAPFIASASPHLFGCHSLAESPDPDRWQWTGDPKARQAWASVRNLNVAPYLGLTAPRLLLRRPYGPESSPIDTFDFQELEHGEHEGYLWGHGAFTVACLLGETFSQSGWSMRSGLADELDGLPLHVYRHDGESQIKPCAETLLNHRAIDAILDAGVMPLVSIKDKDRVRLWQYCSLAADGRGLAGRWGR